MTEDTIDDVDEYVPSDAETISRLESQISFLSERTATLQGQVTAMEQFANIVIGQRNEAQTEVAKLQTQLFMKGN